MKRSKVVVPWREGLHARPATVLVRLARAVRSSIRMRCNGRIADARSILGILLLCATMGSAIEFEVNGEDEDQVVAELESVFQKGPVGGGAQHFDSVAP